MAGQLLDKQEERIRRMFGEIAPWYDRLNHLLSLNIDKRWRRKTAQLLAPVGDGPILDVCTGTGDLAFALDEANQQRLPIIGSDFCPEMLVRAQQKAQLRHAQQRIRFIEADTQQLPFPDNHFQLVTVAFGLRNVTNTDRGLAEMVRVVQPGGRVAILEFSKPRHWLFGRLYRYYFQFLLPLIGQWFSRSKNNAYRYLPASVMQFPDGQALLDRLRQHGLTDLQQVPMTLGIATLYVGTKPKLPATPAPPEPTRVASEG